MISSLENLYLGKGKYKRYISPFAFSGTCSILIKSCLEIFTPVKGSDHIFVYPFSKKVGKVEPSTSIFCTKKAVHNLVFILRIERINPMGSKPKVSFPSGGLYYGVPVSLSLTIGFSSRCFVVSSFSAM